MASVTETHYFSWPAKLRLLLLAAILFLPLLYGVLFDQSQRVYWEKRQLQGWPAWISIETLPDYTSQISRFVNDRIGTAMFLNAAYRKILFYVFNDPPVKNLTLGKDGYIFLNSHSPKRPYRIFNNLCNTKLTDKAFLEFVDKLAGIAGFFSKRGYEFIFAIAPSKPGLYPDYLPNQLPDRYQKACMRYSRQPNTVQKISALLQESGVVLHYPYAEFYKYRMHPGFYPKENFHWQGESVYLFASTLFNEIGLKNSADFFPSVAATFNSSDLLILGFNLRILVWEYQYSGRMITKFNQQPERVKKYYRRIIEYARYQTKIPASNKRAILLSNSFGAAAAPHLAPGYASLIHININDLRSDEYAGFFRQFISRLDVDQVILLIQDSALIKSRIIKQLSLVID